MEISDLKERVTVLEANTLTGMNGASVAERFTRLEEKIDEKFHSFSIDVMGGFTKVTEEFTKVNQDLVKIDRRIDHQTIRIDHLEQTMTEEFKAVRGDIAELKTGQAELRADVNQLKTGQAELRADVNQLKGDVRELKTGQAELRFMLLRLRFMLLSLGAKAPEAS
jgi:chromosome segregation ATPase